MKMKLSKPAASLLITGVTIVCQRQVYGHCDNREPVNDAATFRFDDPSSPDFDANDELADFDFTYFGPDNENIKVFQDDDSYADGRTGCSTASLGFYDYFDDNNNKVTVDCNGDTGVEYSCSDALGETNAECRTAIQTKIGNGVTIPSDDTNCCNSFRFKLDEKIGPIDFTIDESADPKVTVAASINIQTYFSGDTTKAEKFAELCEELFICDQYLKFSDEQLCNANGSRRCPAYVQRSLCFEDFYKPDDDTERNIRSGYIIGSCLGFGDIEQFIEGNEDNSSPEFVNPLPRDGKTADDVLNDLVDRVAGTCNAATDRSNRALYTPTQACTNLLTCYEGLVPPADPADTVDLSNSAYDICGQDDDETLADRLDECQNPGPSQPASYGFEAQCPSYLQDYFKSFPPDYPNDDADDPDYESIILDAVGASGDSRTDAGELGLFKILRVSVAAANIAAEGIRDAFPEDLLYSWKNIVWVGTSAGLQALDIKISKYDFHDGNVDGAEIEAFYENSRQLLDGSAALYDEVRCRKSIDGDTLPAKWGHGCDSVDNDCDREVDECDEDKIPPVIDTSLVVARCSGTTFSSVADAQACVDAAVSAEDDCYPVDLVSTHVAGSSCENTAFELVATAQSCFQETIVTVNEGINVDTVAPEVSCSVSGDGATKDYIWREDGDFAPGSQYGAKLSDVGFAAVVGATAAGDCANDLNVTIKVFSNEAETVPLGNNVEHYEFEDSAIFWLNANDVQGSPGGIYLPIAACNGGNSTNTCIKDPDIAVAARMYTIRVEAVDPAGNVGTDTCRILIPRQQDDLTVDFDDVAASVQRFSIGEYSYQVVPQATP